MSENKWIEVNLADIIHNFRSIKEKVVADTEIMAIVKGNAYGMGYVEVAQALYSEGVKFFGVSNMDEALSLRDTGLECNVLLLDPSLPEEIKKGIIENITFTITSYREAELLSNTGQAMGKIPKCHLYIDTGMHRGEVSLSGAKEYINGVKELKCLYIEGIYTHLPTAFQKVLDVTPDIFSGFSDLIKWLDEENISIPYKHMACSASLLKFPETHLNMVRVGTLLYGGYPNRQFTNMIKLRNPWKLKLKILSIRDGNKGDRVGYGLSTKLKRNTRVALIPLGYADGFMVSTPERPLTFIELLRSIYRLLKQIFKGRGEEIFIKGKKAKLLGRVNMTNSIIDITEIPDLQVGDVIEVKIRAVLASMNIDKIYYNEEHINSNYAEAATSR